MPGHDQSLMSILKGRSITESVMTGDVYQAPVRDMNQGGTLEAKNFKESSCVLNFTLSFLDIKLQKNVTFYIGPV